LDYRIKALRKAKSTFCDKEVKDYGKYFTSIIHENVPDNIATRYKSMDVWKEDNR
jgi:hypothetical protein